jgi:hypothetical protein
MVLQRGEKFIPGKHSYTCKKTLDKSLQAEIVAAVKSGVAQNVFATAKQVVEPIFLQNFEKDPERICRCSITLQELHSNKKKNPTQRIHLIWNSTGVS